MRRHDFAGAALAAGALAAFLGGPAFERTAVAQDQKAGVVLPVFEVDSHFPTMPDHKLLGGVGGATADSHGNVWVFHRPHTLEEGNATENGYMPAPPVVAFSATGRYLQGWGGPAKGGQYEWFNRGGLHSAFAECSSCTAERRLNGDGRPDLALIDTQSHNVEILSLDAEHRPHHALHFKVFEEKSFSEAQEGGTEPREAANSFCNDSKKALKL